MAPSVPLVRGSRLERLASVALPFCLAILIAVVTRLMFSFDGLYGQDAFSYFRFARAIAPHLRDGAALPALYWPRGYPAAVAALLPLMSGSPAAGQIVSTLACAWTATATFFLVRALDRRDEERSGGQSSALAAGLSVACSGAILRTSQVVMADGLAMALTATAMLCGVFYARTGRGPWLVACAVALAWGAVTRWLVGLLALPLFAYLLMTALRPADGSTAVLRFGKRTWLWLSAAALAGLAVLGPQLVVAHAAPLSLERHEWFERWNPVNALGRDFHTREGDSHYRLPVGVFYLARLAWPDYLFPTAAAFAGVGVWVLARERRGAEATLLLGWLFVAWLFISGIPYENPRFLLPILPVVGTLIGVGFTYLRDRLPARRRWLPAAVLAASLLAGLPLGAREHAHIVARKNADRALADWIAARVPSGSTLLMSGGTLVFEYYTSTAVRDIYLLSSPELDTLIAGGGPLLYLENPDEIERRWKGLGPYRHLQALRQRGLKVVDRYPPYTLFRVAL